ncbi:MAG: quinone-dependent dihydroorotate dehydrogenase [Bifidobacteriaceae bacterium]|jgi:dihydroorotate dehydrogenase|nr:quinone-dependent dihydroorotate dehydrogenase [Bifidobacteriaceae bacterium]
MLIQIQPVTWEIVYRLIFNLFFRGMDPERAHKLALVMITAMGEFPPARGLVGLLFGAKRRPGPTGPDGNRLFGRDLTGPLGLAAGFDKDAKAVKGLTALGFSFVEVGTVTRFPQPGNQRPRLWRLLEQRALRNAMGFNNAGSTAVARTLRELRRSPGGRDYVVGVNIGKSKVTAVPEAAADYFVSARRLARYADYLVVNVSSPNTPGLRDLQAVSQLRPVLLAARAGAAQSLAKDGRPGNLPLLVKIAPDLSDEDIDAIADLVEELDLDGVVAVNTTVAHDLGAGGLSGPPLRERGLEVVRRLRQRLGRERTIIGAGGVTCGLDVEAYQAAGANVVQAYTAFIYEGPAWPGRVQRRAARSMAGAGRS